MDLSGSEKGPITGSSEHDYELSDSVRDNVLPDLMTDCQLHTKNPKA
jgi:hypothetical protein